MSVREPKLPADHAFVVQFQSESDPLTGLLQGRAEHIASGQVIHFSSQQELFDFLVKMLKQPRHEGGEPNSY
ncbi:MAG: hypothetical protein AB1898_01475 [Acidobacteriota bacterium]